LKERIKIAFASGSDDLIPTLIERMNALEPSLPLYVVSEFPPPEGRWRPFHLGRTFEENIASVRAAFADKEVVFAGLILQPNMPYWHMRFIPMRLWPLQTIFYNENLDHFMLRPQSLGTIARHFLWRGRNFVRWQLQPGGVAYTFLWRLAHPSAFRRPIHYFRARHAKLKRVNESIALSPQLPEGISVVIPSRNGKELLARLLPGLLSQMPSQGEVIVVDNGSDDGTVQSLPEGVIVELSPEPLSFAAAVNRGIVRARYNHICLINNDMVLDPGFFTSLRRAFNEVPELFAATAQILFPEGVRREETGKAVMPPLNWRRGEDFPVRCDPPVDGEDLSYVLYGSGGCTLYDTAKLRALGAFDEMFAPAYVEDLDVGFRAWMQSWPTVFVSGARVLHMHRSTTKRYFTEVELSLVLERNYLRFAAKSSNKRLWREAIDRINLHAAKQDPTPESIQAMSEAAGFAACARTAPSVVEDMEPTLALCSGAVAVFPGRAQSGRKRILIAAPYLPFPLSHGGAVRMYNLMGRAAVDYDQVLITFADELARPPQELLDICVEIVSVKRVGSHMRVSTGRPDVVEEFASPAFRAAIQMMVRKWKPAIAQLEFTQIAQYAADCAPAKTILVEHDITLDLYAQLLQDREDWETRYQYERWVRFEKEAWRKFDVVVAMSEKDRQSIEGGRAVAIMNGVDLERFQPSKQKPDKARMLFIGSFGHLPNILALDFFLRDVWPLIGSRLPKLHVIAGRRYPYFLEHYKDRVTIDLDQVGIEVEDFVSDVRPAYREAAIMVAPLVASAGTNIKIMEAMAMGKAIVSTPAGINGLDLVDGRDVIVAKDGESMAQAIRDLIDDPARRVSLEREARATAVRDYDWDVIAKEQKKLYESL
jgi:GT2 family glycosyltransferase/glycosyltransferase involved in cell wall biosynthesis